MLLQLVIPREAEYPEIPPGKVPLTMPATRSTRRSQETKTASLATDGAPETAISERKRGLSVTGVSIAKRPKKSSSNSITKQPKSEPKGGKHPRDKGPSEADKSTGRETESVQKAKSKDEEEEAGKPSSTKYTSAGKRETKEDQSAEMNPLAPRASGLRMYVGAHVSAAKGVLYDLGSRDIRQMLLFLKLSLYIYPRGPELYSKQHSYWVNISLHFLQHLVHKLPVNCS